ncbi:MAG: shikimate kinase [Bacteroidales bacterium]|nr:shikimate kinase [Bacteroidales bacterium]
MRLFIIGYKSSGKTTIGKKLANRLNLEFVDLDHEIEARESKSVPELYNSIGDAGFRLLEWEALREIVKRDNIIVSTGGGAPCHCNNMGLMEKYGDVLYIQLDNDTLVSRLKHAVKDRPIVKNKTDQELREYIADLRYRCEHHYLRAKYVIDGKDITVDKIIELLKKKNNV